MAREKGTMLDTEDIFPEMDFHAVSGKQISLPNNLLRNWTVLLFYRGHW
ncbi:MAG: hypothetical protein JSV13_02185 [Nitrospiraceae bacterium]|jgi:alkyl hydroperoxide reductase subunit AhpC|nr:MAG: hypothetical protein JSV13_02185 [Nitrospiraceae bacterium]